MAFEKKVPEWNAVGSEPPASLKNRGFESGYKPPAEYFNWFWNRVSEVLKELQAMKPSDINALSEEDFNNLSLELRNLISGHKNDKNNPHGVTATQLGLASVATTGSYNDLKNKPSIPTVPSSLPANGGNADTLDGKHADEFASADHATNKNNPHGVTAEQIGTVLTGDIPNLHIWGKYANNPAGYREETLSSANLSSSAYSGTAHLYYSSEININNDKFYVGDYTSLVGSDSSTFEVIKGKHVIDKYKSDGYTDYIYYIPPTAKVEFTGSTVKATPCIKLTIGDTEPLGYVASKENNAYPTNGQHADGYWYLYCKQLGESEHSAGTSDLTAGVSALETGKYYWVLE